MGFVISTATSNPSPASWAAGVEIRVRRSINFSDLACASTAQRLHRAVRNRKEAMERRLQDFVLELLAAIVLIAIFMILTDPAARSDS